MSVATLNEEPVRKARVSPMVGSYALPKERPLWVFLIGSTAALVLATVAYGMAVRPEPAPKVIEIELNDINAVPGEPPPKGDAADAPPEPTPQAAPEPTPEPEPEPTPEPPPPEEKPEFVKPEPAPTPTPPPPKPKPAVTRPPQPTPRPAAASAPAPPPRAASAPAGTRGTANGVVGGRGGSKGDFLSTPKPQYDVTALQRHYRGSGEVLITYANGSISSVVMTRSTGVPYLDTKTTTHVKSNYRVKPGASGKATFNIAWTLPR